MLGDRELRPDSLPNVADGQSDRVSEHALPNDRPEHALPNDRPDNSLPDGLPVGATDDLPDAGPDSLAFSQTHVAGLYLGANERPDDDFRERNRHDFEPGQLRMLREKCFGCCVKKYSLVRYITDSMKLIPIVFDLESSFIVKGAKRTHSVIFEIGAVDVHSQRTFHTFVNPFKYTSEDSLYDAIAENRKQKVSSSLHFWHSLLFNDTSSCNALKDTEIAGEIQNYNAIHDVPSTAEMLLKFETFVKKSGKLEDTVIVAHNGRSFDFKIIEGNAEKGTFWKEDNGMYFVDSYRHLAVPMYKGTGRKTGLGPLFKYLMPANVSFRHHRALDDSLATACVVHGMAVEYACKNHAAFEHVFEYSFCPQKAYDIGISHGTDAINFFVHHLGIRKQMTACPVDWRNARNRKSVSCDNLVSDEIKSKFYNSVMNIAPMRCTNTDKIYPVSYFALKSAYKSLKISIPSVRKKSTVSKISRLDSDVSTLAGVGKITTEKLNTLHLYTVKELVDKRVEVSTRENMEMYLKAKKIYRHKKLAGVIEEYLQIWNEKKPEIEKLRIQKIV